MDEFSHEVETSGIAAGYPRNWKRRKTNLNRLAVGAALVLISAHWLVLIRLKRLPPCMIYNFYFFNLAKIAIELDIHVSKRTATTQ